MKIKKKRPGMAHLKKVLNIRGKYTTKLIQLPTSCGHLISDHNRLENCLEHGTRSFIRLATGVT